MNDRERYTATTALPVSIESAFQYHARPGALQRLLPPWESVEIESSSNSIAQGSEVTLRAHVFGVPIRWLARHTHYDPPHRFADTQVSGPMATWDHSHEFSSLGNDQSVLRDRIEYRLPAGPVGRLLGGWKAKSSLESMFAFRHRITRDDLQLHQDHPSSPMTVAVSGASGLVGSQLCPLLSVLGHRVCKIVRSRNDDPESLAIWKDDADAAKLADADAVIHLAGKSIAGARWTDSMKREIRESRVTKTRELCEKLAKLPRPPRTLLCASATGIYGDRGDESLDETSALGDGFLADVARQWEQACQPAVDAGVRVIHCRFGIVLSPRGGALGQMILPAKFAGGSLGSGKQWWSWIALDDVLGAIYHALLTQSLVGPVNFVSPDPIRNRDFAKVLGDVIGRPALIPAPAFGLRLMLGEMADALLLASQRVVPTRLTESGYRFRFTELRELLRYSLGYERLPSERQE